jgi:hypothetical protein
MGWNAMGFRRSRPDQLVDEIRQRRRRLGAAAAVAAPLAAVGASVRRAPAAWMVGGALTGLALTRFLGPRLAEAGRGAARTALMKRVLSGLGQVVAAVAASPSGEGAQPAAATPPAPPIPAAPETEPANI